MVDRISFCLGTLYIIKLFIAISLLLLSPTALLSQNDFRVMFYNVENLFDTKDDPAKNDDEFLPDGGMRWTNYKYWEKLRNITRVITAVGGMQSPALVGLCEVENDSVIFDLTRRSPLRAQGYEYIITNSPDQRGVDVALLYQRHQFNLLEKNEYEIIFSDKAARPTRNLLHAVGKVINGDTIDVFVCHWPSRSGGQQESEPARLDAARLLRAKTDSIFAIRQRANIVIMGDFNDHPDNKSLYETLGAEGLKGPYRNHSLYNMFYHRMRENEFGTYSFQGRWEILDQFIVSGNLLTQDNPLRIKNNSAHVFKADFLLRDGRYGNKEPFRTHLGPRYLGGFSDHLPIFMDIIIE